MKIESKIILFLTILFLSINFAVVSIEKTSFLLLCMAIIIGAYQNIASFEKYNNWVIIFSTLFLIFLFSLDNFGAMICYFVSFILIMLNNKKLNYLKKILIGLAYILIFNLLSISYQKIYIALYNPKEKIEYFINNKLYENRGVDSKYNYSYNFTQEEVKILQKIEIEEKDNLIEFSLKFKYYLPKSYAIEKNNIKIIWNYKKSVNDVWIMQKININDTTLKK